MINEYYILRQNEKEGPYTHLELMEIGIRTDDFILSPLADGMTQASDLPEFQEYFRSIGVFMPEPRTVASFWWRLLAFIIDYIVTILLITILLSTISIIAALVHHRIDTASNDFDLLTRVIFSLGLVFYHSIFELTELQGGLGKYICKMMVVDGTGQRLTAGQAFGRNFSKLISSFLCGLGFLNVLWSPMKQGWHDQMAKAYVVRKS